MPEHKRWVTSGRKDPLEEDLRKVVRAYFEDGRSLLELMEDCEFLATEEWTKREGQNESESEGE